MSVGDAGSKATASCAGLTGIWPAGGPLIGDEGGEEEVVATQRLLELHEFLFGTAGGAELEADDSVALESLGEPSEGFGAGAVLAALDSRDHRRGRAHALGEVLLGQPEMSPAHDDNARELLEGSKPILRVAVPRAPGALVFDVVFDRGADRAVVLGHGGSLSSILESR